jgi:hypothetical protein
VSQSVCVLTGVAVGLQVEPVQLRKESFNRVPQPAVTAKFNDFWSNPVPVRSIVSVKACAFLLLVATC